MTHTANAAMLAGRKAFKTPTTKQAYENGFERGYNCASWVDMPEIGDKLWTDADGRVTIDEDNLWDTMQSIACESESSSRDFSPFEHTAHAFNKARNSEAQWEAFDAGISDGINANLSERAAQQTKDGE